MTEEERKKLIKKRKEKLQEKEMLKSLHTDLDLEDRRQSVRKNREKNENPYARKAVIFFGNLLVLYVFFFLVRYLSRIFIGPIGGVMGVDLSAFNIVFHAAIWGISIYSTYTEDPILDRIIQNYF